MSLATPLGLLALLLLPLLVLWHVRRRRPRRIVVPSLLPFVSGAGGPPPRPRRVLDLSLVLQCLVVVAGTLGLCGASCSAGGPSSWTVVVDRSLSMQGRQADVARALGGLLAESRTPPELLRLETLGRSGEAIVVAASTELGEVFETLFAAVPPAPAADGLPRSLAPHLAGGGDRLLITDRAADAIGADPSLRVLSIGAAGIGAGVVGYVPDTDQRGRLRVRMAGTGAARDPAAIVLRVGDEEHRLQPAATTRYADVPVEAPRTDTEVVLVLESPSRGAVELDRVVLLPATEGAQVFVADDTPEVVGRLLQVWGVERAVTAADADVRVRTGVPVDEAAAPTIWLAPAAGPYVQDAASRGRLAGADVVGRPDVPTLPAPVTRLEVVSLLEGDEALWRGPDGALVLELPRHTVIGLRVEEPWTSDASFPALLAHTLDRLVPQAGRPPRIEREFLESELLPPPADASRPDLAGWEGRSGRRSVDLVVWCAAAVFVGLLGLLVVEARASRRGPVAHSS